MAKLNLSPEQSTYSTEEGTGVVRFELEGGPAALYADQLGASHTVNVTWVCNPDEYEELIAFHAAESHRPFQIDLVIDSPFAEEYTAQFVPRSASLVEQSGETYVVEAKLEVTPLAADANLDELIIETFANGDSLTELLKLLGRLVNVNLPDAV